ncbi:hypothetical protein C3L33_02705, partial [Rhododendron williamsianum]
MLVYNRQMLVQQSESAYTDWIPKGIETRSAYQLLIQVDCTNTVQKTTAVNSFTNERPKNTKPSWYELPDSHPLLNGLDKREPDDPSPYLLAIWTPGETANSVQLPEGRCGSQESGKLCNEKTCFSCNSMREANAHTVRGTILIPCRTAMRGSFPLNGTYFQVNEMFADHESSLNPIDVPRAWIWNLPRRTVYFGTSVSTIFKGLTTEGIQYCFWRGMDFIEFGLAFLHIRIQYELTDVNLKNCPSSLHYLLTLFSSSLAGFVCVRGFDHRTRAPRPLMARLHFPASKLAKTKNEANKKVV